ncbi:DNA damage-regulated autophagy modulator protein 1 isoform X2 [Mus caroli]|uniref:DNA damage-regulated autophagy modulator protein 1 isoform X2 n=1 Tax=Mus caroli TaxID=10089 RepID=A0A6P7RC76_MUSCR|nr:DNA damage-regulated autophagy modulator protein 1 isoform X2 [Mus caroli]
MLCFLRGMAFVPFLLVTWSSAAFIISYVVAVLSGHVNPFLPYISDTGTTPPESGIFGFMINFSAFLGAATMYTRYKIVEKQNETCYFSTPVFNLVSLVLGLVGCIGMGIVANFQELAVPVVHDGGALLAFVCGVVYTLLQSIISYKSCPQWNSLTTCHVRMAISAVSCAAVVPIFKSDCLCFTYFYNQAGMESKRKGLYISRGERHLRVDRGFWFYFLFPNIHPRFPECHSKDIHRNQ